MKWEKKTKYYYEAASGHRISICRVKGKLIYELWNPKREFIGMYDTPEKAREAAKKHAGASS